MRRSILFAGTAPPGKKPGRYVPWVENYAVRSGIVTGKSGIVTDRSGNMTAESGKHLRSVTFGRIRRSRSTGLTGHVRRIQRSRCAGIPSVTGSSIAGFAGSVLGLSYKDARSYLERHYG
jgi:outer membrane lipoprotein SlyB